MYGFNVSAKFETDRGSMYIVTSTGVERHKVKDGKDSGIHGGENKNIFYVEPKHRETMLSLKDSVTRKIVSSGPDEIYIEYRDGETTRSVHLEKSPKLGLRPFDIFVNPDGTVPNNACRHLGHEIVKMIS
jgi:hypothetical protein